MAAAMAMRHVAAVSGTVGSVLQCVVMAAAMAMRRVAAVSGIVANVYAGLTRSHCRQVNARVLVTQLTAIVAVSAR